VLTEQTFQKLTDMKMHGFALALKEQLDGHGYDELSFEERIGFLVDREWTEREARRLTRRLQSAKLREQAAIEDIDFRYRRGLDTERPSRPLDPNAEAGPIRSQPSTRRGPA